jgi:hypothetical protein
MQSAEKAGRDHGDAFLALFFGQPRDLFHRVGLQPFLGAEADWKVVVISVSSQPRRSFSRRVVFWHWQ